MKIFVIFAGFIAAVSSVALGPCGDPKIPMPKSVKIDDCDPKVEERCDFFRGHNVKIFVDFTALSDLSSLEPMINVTASSTGEKDELPLPDNRYEGCEWLEGSQKCPIPKGKDATWRLSIPVVLTVPLVPLALDISLMGNGNQTQFCFNLKGQIVV